MNMLLLRLLCQTLWLAWKLPLALEIDSGRRPRGPTRVAHARFLPSFRMSEGLFIASALLGVGDGGRNRMLGANKTQHNRPYNTT